MSTLITALPVTMIGSTFVTPAAFAGYAGSVGRSHLCHMRCDDEAIHYSA